MFCRNCGKEVQEDWVQCPYCGTRLKAENVQIDKSADINTSVNEKEIGNEKQKKPIYRKWWFWLIAIFSGIIVYAAIWAVNPKEAEPVDIAVKEIADYSELAGVKEESLADYGIEKSDEYELGYGALDGAVEVGCTDGKVDKIKIIKSKEEDIFLCGIKIGIPEEEAYQKLLEAYPEDMSKEEEKIFADFESKEQVRCESREGKISTVFYTVLSDEEIEEYQKAKEEAERAEYIFPDSDSKYLSEDEINGVNEKVSFIGMEGTYICANSSEGMTGQVEVYGLGSDGFNFSLGSLELTYDFANEYAQIIDSNTAQATVYGVTLTFYWTDAENMIISRNGEFAGMDAGPMGEITDNQSYIRPLEFNQ